MKAAVLHDFKEPQVFEEVPRPQLEPSDVLIKVEACGVCHSDLHVADGDWSQLSAIVKRPLILGHEIAGRVIEKGGDVHDLQIGDRVEFRGCTGRAASVNCAWKGMRTCAPSKR